MLSEIVFILYTAVLYGALLLLVTGLNRFTAITVSSGANFSQPLEALRGIAAAMVLGAHTSMYFGAADHPQTASSFLGATGVMIFFFLTGHLFWSQVLSGRFDFSTFFQKRIRRLVPAATLMVATIMLLDWAMAMFPLPTPSQLVLLLKNFAFGFGGTNDVFLPSAVQRINVIWSLKWEWLFYLVLPLAACFRHPLALTAFCLGLIVVFYDLSTLLSGLETEAVFVVAFLFGGLLAHVDRLDVRYLNAASRFLASPFFAAAWMVLIACYLFAGPLQIVLVRSLGLLGISTGIFLYFWAAKHSAVAWMSAAPVQLVGKISYSFYLWHLAVAWYVINIAERLVPTRTLLGYLGLSLLITAISSVVAMASFRWVELPFMRARTKGDVVSPARETAMQPKL